MTQSWSPRIFVSYAHKDGMQLAQRLQRDLSTEGLDVWVDTERLHGGATWTVEIDRALELSQVVLALLTPGSYESDLCRAEQLRALRKGKRVIPLLGQPGTGIPLHLESRQYRDFTGTKPYAPELRLLVEDIRHVDDVPVRSRYHAPHVTAPPLPGNFIERPEALAMLRRRLITDGSGPTIAVTALRGMGGIGKTVLAQDLARDEIVQEAFPDGIIWITAGKESAYNLTVRMSEVLRALGDTPTEGVTELESINRYRTLIQDKAALIIVDDVWRAEDVEPFRASSTRSRLLFTTRNGSIVASLGAEEHVADLLTTEQSRDLLTRSARLEGEELPSEAESILQECGRLPLSLSMIGAILRDKPPAYWRHTLKRLQSANLGDIGAQFPGSAHQDLLRAIQVSVDALDETARQRYLALAILIEDMPVHPSIQQTLWNANEEDASATAEQLVSLSLAQREAEGSFRLHDLQLDYVRGRYADRTTLELVRAAVRLSWHVISKDPTQFASQIVGRLLSCPAGPALQEIILALTRGAPCPWLRPTAPALRPPGSTLVRTLEGRFSDVTALALSPDAGRVFAASGDREIVVWDLESGREPRALTGLRIYILSLSISPDARQVASVSPRGVHVWDVETGSELHVRPPGRFGRVLLTPEGKLALSASLDKLELWDLATGQLVRTLKGHFDFPFIEHAAVSERPLGGFGFAHFTHPVGSRNRP
jgi:hypothetical protein